MTCGAEDEHERRDCPMALMCFACGGRGHRQAVRGRYTFKGSFTYTFFVAGLSQASFQIFSSARVRSVRKSRSSRERETTGRSLPNAVTNRSLDRRVPPSGGSTLTDHTTSGARFRSKRRKRRIGRERRAAGILRRNGATTAQKRGTLAT